MLFRSKDQLVRRVPKATLATLAQPERQARQVHLDQRARRVRKESKVRLDRKGRKD